MKGLDFTYQGTKTKEISFPVGGIGSGSIGLSGNGRLIDWEIFNKPNKESINGFSHFAVKAESNGKLLDARVLNGDYPYPHTGSRTKSLGHGVERKTMAGLPHFRDCLFEGQYPFAEITFRDEAFPGIVQLTSFNPLIPLNDKDSSLPAAFFMVEIENPTEKEIEYTVCLSVSNPHKNRTMNLFDQQNKLTMIKLCTELYEEDDPNFGDITVSTDHDDISLQQYWYRGAWFDGLIAYWQDFCKPGKLQNRVYTESLCFDSGLVEHHKREDTCSLAAHLVIGPGMRKSARFLITWNFPNCHNYWNPEKSSCDDSCKQKKPTIWKNYYATIFKDSKDSALYCFNNWDRLYEETLKFKNALFQSSMPKEVIEAVSANISILKTPTVLRLEDGSFYGWEGCNYDSGSCEGSCTHVWNYAYVLPFLFPELERSMRYLDYKYNQREDGSMCFRLQLPLGRERMDFRACVDGQFGGVIKAYRDWKISGDTKWLKSIWTEIKKSIEFAWAETNEDKWDTDKDGVIEGRQHHTLDMELFGPNSWLNGFYLAALKAGAEMAEFLGEQDTAQIYRELFEKGKKWTDAHLFNGEYYYHLIDINDKSIIDKFSDGGSIIGISTEEAYWNEEKKEIKNQIGEGCGIDQVLAQWHSNICGLGEIFDKQQTLSALKSIYKYNFKKSFRNYFNPCRIYALNDDSGVVICEWPEGKKKPSIPAPYSEECWTGCEYQVAAHMIQEGLVKEGTEIVAAVRRRFDGENRNPWNEFECGSNYARAMSSYSLLLAFSGFEFDMVKGMIGFNPQGYNRNERLSYFWSLDCAWGLFISDSDKVEIRVLGGNLKVKEIKLSFLADYLVESIAVNGCFPGYDEHAGSFSFYEDVNIGMNQSMVIRLR